MGICIPEGLIKLNIFTSVFFFPIFIECTVNLIYWESDEHRERIQIYSTDNLMTYDNFKQKNKNYNGYAAQVLKIQRLLHLVLFIFLLNAQLI